MDNEQMILRAIAQLTDTVTKGFQDMEGRFEGIESRLDGQERKLRRTAVRQQLQDSQIEELSKIVQDMAENAPPSELGRQCRHLQGRSLPELRGDRSRQAHRHEGAGKGRGHPGR